MHYYGTRLSENISRRFRKLSRRDSTLWSSLTSLDLRADEISATGSRRLFAPRALGLNYAS